jgi:CubicO group peptidase (beta-lactamase class C family)
MADSGYDEQAPGVAQGYQYGSIVAEPVDVSWHYATGGVYSTVEDLYRWDQALETDTLLPQAALQAMFTGHIPLVNDTSYGYGWGIGPIKGHYGVYEIGDIDGYVGYNGRFLDDRVTVIILSNDAQAPLFSMVEILIGQAAP